MANYLAEAFKAFDALEEDTFEVSDSGIEQLDGFLDDSSAFDKDTIEVFDLEAENEEDLKDSYVGEAILDCCVCHEKLFKKKEDIIIDEEAQVANVGEECPYCFSVDGFMVLGEVAPFQPKKEKEEVEVEETAEITESCENRKRGGIKKKAVKEDIDLTNVDDEWLTAYDAIKSILEDYGYDIDDSRVEDFMANAADYILEIREVEDEDYDAVEWFYDTEENYPEELEELPMAESLKEDTVKQNGKWVNKGKEGTHGTFKTKKAADAQRKAMFARGFREELKKKLIPESLGSDVDKFQEWVDYDMKRYGRISKQTEKEVEEAGLEIVKDKYGDYQVIAGRYNESLEEVSIKTNDSKTEVKTEDDGKIIVEVEPKEDCCDEEKEVIKPLSKEDEEKIEDNSEEIEEVDDVSFDELEESFLKKVYSNIDSYKTASIKNKDGKFFVEGIIKFNSGKTKKASFIFESAGKTPRNKYKLIGESIQITPKKNAFRILGSKVGNKFVSESMNYDYRTKNLKESLRVNGRVARALGEDIDLTNKKGSITNVLTAHKEELAKASSVKEMLGLLSKWFKEEGIDTPASRRLINNVAKKKDIADAQFVVYNSILKGAGQGVI